VRYGRRRCKAAQVRASHPAQESKVGRGQTPRSAASRRPVQCSALSGKLTAIIVGGATSTSLTLKSAPRKRQISGASIQPARRRAAALIDGQASNAIIPIAMAGRRWPAQVTFEGALGDTSPISFKWRYNGKPMPGARINAGREPTWHGDSGIIRWWEQMVAVGTSATEQLEVTRKLRRCGSAAYNGSANGADTAPPPTWTPKATYM